MFFKHSHSLPYLITWPGRLYLSLCGLLLTCQFRQCWPKLDENDPNFCLKDRQPCKMHKLIMSKIAFLCWQRSCLEPTWAYCVTFFQFPLEYFRLIHLLAQVCDQYRLLWKWFSLFWYFTVSRSTIVQTLSKGQKASLNLSGKVPPKLSDMFNASLTLNEFL